MSNNAWKSEKRRIKQEEFDRECEERARRQAECDHYDCAPSEWNWDGTVREMRCNSCGETNYIGHMEKPFDDNEEL